VLAGVTTTYNTGLRYGGPASMTLGWLVVAAFNGCVALSMAEICSAYPTSGGLYYWSAKLAGKEWAPLASWVTGWFNIVGQVRRLDAHRSFGRTLKYSHDLFRYLVTYMLASIFYLVMNSCLVSLIGLSSGCTYWHPGIGVVVSTREPAGLKIPCACLNHIAL
jgi:amino acid transporter